MTLARTAGLLSLGLLVSLAWGQSPLPPTDSAGDPLPTGALLRMGTVRWRTGSGPDMSSALGKDGRLMFVSYGEAVRVSNLDTGELVRTLKGHEGGISCLALSPDGQTLALAGYKGGALWDAASGGQLRPLKVSAAVVIAFSPDGKRVITGGQDHERSVRIFDVESGKEQLPRLHIFYFSRCPAPPVALES
jgi:WD40 repeat protein